MSREDRMKALAHSLSRADEVLRLLRINAEKGMGAYNNSRDPEEGYALLVGAVGDLLVDKNLLIRCLTEIDLRYRTLLETVD